MQLTKFKRERERFPLLKKYAYFETYATGAIPDYVYQAVARYQDARYKEGGDSSWDGKSTFEMIEDTRAIVARMINAEPEDIAFGENTSLMFGQLTAGLPLEPGDNVIMTDTTFRTMAYAWDLKRQLDGLELRYAPSHEGRVDPQDIFRMVDSRTRVISLNHVENETGYRHQLTIIGDFCRQNGIILAVDAAQSAGVMPIDVKSMNIDFLAGNTYKWMLNYCGVGYAFISSTLREKMRPFMAGWRTSRDVSSLTLDLKPGASRFEYGYPNAPGIYALGKTAARYCELGPYEIEDYVLDLGEYVYESAKVYDGLGVYGQYNRANRSGILVLTADSRYAPSSQEMKKRGVIVSVRNGAPYGAAYAMRLGLHYYTNTSDIDRLFAALAACRQDV